jgi:glycosyltransferase involved in cell wall biosynthesis
MVHITYVGNFLSEHGLNPTYSEALVPKLCEQGLAIRPASRYHNPLLRFIDMGAAVWKAPRKRSCVILDLCSGPRAFPAAFLVSRMCRLTHKPYIVVLHGGNLPSLLSTSRARLVRILKDAQRVVSPSSFLASQFSKYVNVDVIPNALNLQSYAYRQRVAPKPNFLYLRAFHTLYGPLIAIRAFAIVQQQYVNARLVMVGPEIDNVLSECKALASSLGLEANIEFLGRVPKSQIPELGNQSDIFVNPTCVDNTPVSIVEAMAMGMCLVATNVGGLPYLLQDGETALLVPPTDEHAMAAAMLRVLREPELAGQLSKKARAAAEHMDWSAVLPKWLEVIESVTGLA